MLKISLTLKKIFILASIALIISCPAFASRSYKEAAVFAPPPPPPTENSLQGWNGELPVCSEKNLHACWERSAHYVEHRTWYPVVSLGAGAVITSTVGQSKSFQILNPDTDEFFYYNAEKPSQTGALFEIFLGGEWILDPWWNLQAGVDFDQVYTSYNSSGTFIQGADVQSQDQYNYNYSAITRQILAETKLLYNFRNAFRPYLLLGLGAAFNSAYGYNTSVPPFLTFTRQFSDNTNTGFTYALGLGFDLDITKDFRLGLGYRFTDLGKISLGPATIRGIPVSGTLTQTHMYSHMMLAQITFIF